MPSVSNKIFGVLLSAYMEGLHATIEYSKELQRVKHNDVSLSAINIIAYELTDIYVVSTSGFLTWTADGI